MLVSNASISLFESAFLLLKADILGSGLGGLAPITLATPFPFLALSRSKRVSTSEAA
jgi:hypothetical protein